MGYYFKHNQYYFIMLRKLIYIENRLDGLIVKIRGPIQIYNALYIYVYIYIYI